MLEEINSKMSLSSKSFVQVKGKLTLINAIKQEYHTEMQLSLSGEEVRDECR